MEMNIPFFEEVPKARNLYNLFDLFLLFLWNGIFKRALFLSVKSWESYLSGNVADYIRPNRMTTLAPFNLICTSTNTPRVLIAVHSEIQNADLRMAIRKTWADSLQKQFNIGIAFFVGLSDDGEINVSKIHLIFLEKLDFRARVHEW